MKKAKLKILFALIILSSSFACASMNEDASITEDVRARLILEKDIPAKDITVSTKDNVVFLKGVVSTSIQAERIIKLAASLENVLDVDYTDLKIRNSRSLATDEWITAKVQGRIIQLFDNKKISDGYDLTVETNNKQVHIFGTISKAGDIAIIEDSVKKIKYVKAVKTNIKVIE